MKRVLFLVLIFCLSFFVKDSVEAVAADSLIQAGNITYLGAFTIPSVGSSNCNESYKSANAIGFNAAGNGGAGSLFISSGDGDNTPGGTCMSEISIPSSLYTGSTLSGLNASSYIASFLQSSGSTYFWDPTNGNYAKVAAGGTALSNVAAAWRYGGFYVSGSSILITSYNSYAANGGSVLPFSTHSTKLSDSSYAGHYGPNISNVYSGAAGDMMSGALGPVPSAYQSQLGGTVMAGSNPFNMSVISRTSIGPSVVVFDPANFGAANTLSSSVNGYMLAGYEPNVHDTLGKYSGSVSNQYVSNADHYAGILFPPNSRSVLVVGVHGIGGPGLECNSQGHNWATSGADCYGPATGTCSEACGYGNLPACGSGTCGGQSIGSFSCCYDPNSVGMGHGNVAYPYTPYVWAFDVGDASGNNTSGNTVSSSGGTPSKNNLTAVKLGQIKPWDMVPYAVWQIPRHWASNGAYYAVWSGATFDPMSSRLYVSVWNGIGGGPDVPIIEVYQIGTGSTPPPTIPAPTGLKMLPPQQ